MSFKDSSESNEQQDDLLSFLMETNENPTAAVFDRQGSGRRRRARESMFAGDIPRERQPSPAFSMSTAPLTSMPHSVDIDVNQPPNAAADSSRAEVIRRRHSINPFARDNSSERNSKTDAAVGKQPTERRRLPAEPVSSASAGQQTATEAGSLSKSGDSVTRLIADTVRELELIGNTTTSTAASTAQPQKHSMALRSMTKQEGSLAATTVHDANISTQKDVESNEADFIIDENEETTASPLRRTRSLGGSFIRYREKKTSPEKPSPSSSAFTSPSASSSIANDECLIQPVSYSPVNTSSSNKRDGSESSSIASSQQQQNSLPDKRRWGLFIDSEQTTAEQVTVPTFRRTQTLPRRWRPHMRDEIDGSTHEQTIAEEPEERGDTPVHSTMHGKISVVGKLKFKQLSQKYSSTEDDTEVWQKRQPDSLACSNTSDMSQSDLCSSSSLSLPSSSTLAGRQRGSSGNKWNDDRVSSDRESIISSGRDEGFDSESISDHSVSQRTSMSSTLESELMLTPLLTRREFVHSTAIEVEAPVSVTEQEEETSESNKYFARSIDSLVHKSDLSLVQNGGSSRTLTESIASMRSREGIQESTLSLVEKPTTTRSEMYLPTATTAALASSSSLAVQSSPSTRYIHDNPPSPPKRTSSMSSNLSKTPEASPLTKGHEGRSSRKDSADMQERRRSMLAAPLSSGKTSTPTAATLSSTNKNGTTPPRHGAKTSSPTQTGNSAAPSTPTSHKLLNSAASGGRASPKTTSSSATPVVRSSPTTRQVTSPAMTSTLSPLVRGSPARATLPVEVLRANRKAAAANADAKEAKEGVPTPPRRSSSIRLSGTPGKGDMGVRYTPSPSKKPTTNAAGNIVGCPSIVESNAEEVEERPTISVVLSPQVTRDNGLGKSGIKIIDVIVKKTGGKDAAKKDANKTSSSSYVTSAALQAASSKKVTANAKSPAGKVADQIAATVSKHTLSPQKKATKVAVKI